MTDEETTGNEEPTRIDRADADWWASNERLRDQLGLSSYEPPQFSDGTYVQTAVSELEAEFGCSIRIVGINASHGDDWSVQVDGKSVASIGRKRARDGTTVYGMTVERFRQIVAAQF